MYVENARLIGMFQSRLRRKYGHCISKDDINSAVDIAFIKAARAWDPDAGKLSTIFWSFASGEVLHAIRDSANWGIASTQRARAMGTRAKGMLDAGMSVESVCAELSISVSDLIDILLAVSGVSGLTHEPAGFDQHACNRPTPWEALEASEAS